MNSKLSTETAWFHMFKELIKSERWANLSLAAKALYPVIKAFVSWDEGLAFPSLETLQKYSGLSRASVVKALKELVDVGMLERVTTRGRKAGGRYKIIESFDVEIMEQPHIGSVSFDYLPSVIKDSVAELKNFVSNAALPTGQPQYIRIDSLTLNIVMGNQNNMNIKASDEHISSLREALNLPTKT